MVYHETRRCGPVHEIISGSRSRARHRRDQAARDLQAAEVPDWDWWCGRHGHGVREMDMERVDSHGLRFHGSLHELDIP